jgi:hypothetical protein
MNWFLIILIILVLGSIFFSYIMIRINTTQTVEDFSDFEYSFPIEGISNDGELVKDVLKRLETDNPDKLSYFKKYMNIT